MAVTALAVTALFLVSPEEGFEPTTNGLTVHCSTAELFRIRDVHYSNRAVNFLQQGNFILLEVLLR